MAQRAQAVVIGGGVVGCSVLYHLVKAGWSDVVLLERSELTSGSTWHAAANIHGLHDNTTITRLQHETLRLYRALEAETGQSCGIVQPGSLYLAQTEARAQQLRLQAAKARAFGMGFYEIDRAEAEARHPLVDFDGIRCIMFEPDGGHVDPSGVTAAYAAGARAGGARIERFTPVTGLRREGAVWRVESEAGDWLTPWVVNAAGLWAREVAALAGVTLPLQPTEHQYFVTEPLEMVKGRALPSVADRDGEYYLRQEGQGLLVGAYERDVRLWAEAGTPLDFAHELFPDDLERIEPNMLRAMARLPALAEAGIKRVINGPMIWSPDGNALMGELPEAPGVFNVAGIIPGFSQSGGLGRMAAEWITTGAPEHDLFFWDVARFGAWADERFTRARVRDLYAHRFAIHFPGEERGAGRPCLTRPVYDAQKAMGAVMGLNAGWEHPLWFAERPGVADEAGFTRQNGWHAANAEALRLRLAVGVIDVSNFAKTRVTGAEAHRWLSLLLAGRIPTRPGQMGLAPLIGARGGIAGDFTVVCLAEGDYMLFGSGAAERMHQRMMQAVPLPHGTVRQSLSAAWAGFAIAGPNARLALEALAGDLGDFPFFSARWLDLAGLSVLALRVSFTGDLGWELYCAEADQAALYAALLQAAKAQGGGPVGSRAMMALRLEKGYGSWGRDYTLETWPHEVGLARVCQSEAGFLNRGALERALAHPPRSRLWLLELDKAQTDASFADASGGEPVFASEGDGQALGQITSGGYSAYLGKSLALAMLERAAPGQGVQVMVLGKPHRANLLAEPPFDPKSVRLRG